MKGITWTLWMAWIQPAEPHLVLETHTWNGVLLFGLQEEH